MTGFIECGTVKAAQDGSFRAREEKGRSVMNRFSVLLMIVFACLGISRSNAGQWRGAPPIMHLQRAPMVVPHYGQQSHYGNYGHQGVVPHQGNFGRHGLPMVQGRTGWHEVHNRSHFRTFIPGYLFGATFASVEEMNVEDFISEIDATSAYETVDPCTTPVCTWAAMSWAVNGATAGAYGTTLDQARASAHLGCMTVAQGQPCSGFLYAVGTAWMVALYCQRNDDDGSSAWNTIVSNGNDLGAALRNAYRLALSNGFAPDDCSWINAIAADGSQNQISAQLE